IDGPESRFDENGNCRYLPHLRGFDWNYRNNLSRAILVERDGDSPDDAEYYVYGGNGSRVRKVTERLEHGRVVVTEKIYLDGCEIKRIRAADHIYLERKTSHVSDGSSRIAALHQWSVDEIG